MRVKSSYQKKSNKNLKIDLIKWPSKMCTPNEIFYLLLVSIDLTKKKKEKKQK